MDQSKTTSKYATTKSQDLASLYESAREAHKPFRVSLDEKEAIHLSRNTDVAGSDLKSKINDGRLSTMNIDGSARVIAQLPTGTVRAMGAQNRGRGLLAQYLLSDYIMPNDMAQGMSFLERARLMRMMSKMYGKMISMSIWNVDENYVGPSEHLVAVRHVTPQPGRPTIGACDYLFIDVTRTVKFLKQRLRSKAMGGWNESALRKVMARAEDAIATYDPKHDDPQYSSFIERNRTYLNQTGGRGDLATVSLVQMFEPGAKGEWIYLCPDFEWEIVYRKTNPSGSARLQFHEMNCIPLFDDFWGLGDYERGASLQHARNTWLNLHVDSAKLALYPPKLIDLEKVARTSSIVDGAGQNWYVTDVNNAIKPYLVNPQSGAVFQPTWEVLTASILNLQGNTDTAVSNSTDVGFGKTPQALKMQDAREATRDNWDRFYAEQWLSRVYDDYLDMLSRNQEKAIDLSVMSDQIQKIRAQLGDNSDDELFKATTINMDGMTGSIKVTKNLFRDENGKAMPTKFYIDAGSTYKRDQVEEAAGLEEMVTMIAKVPQILDLMARAGKTIDIAEAVKRMVIAKGVSDPEKIVIDLPKQAAADPLTGQPMDGGANPEPGEPPVIEGVTVPGPQATQPAPLTTPNPKVQDPAIAEAMARVQQ